MNKQQIVLNFLKAYKAWVEAGASEHEFFVVKHGLCGNLTRYVCSTHTNDENIIWEILGELFTLFAKDGLCTMFPFNRTSEIQPLYSKEVHHENPWRIQWVANTINKLEG